MDDYTKCDICGCEMNKDESDECTNGDEVCKDCSSVLLYCNHCNKFISEENNQYGLDSMCDHCADSKADKLMDRMKDND